tara:strand:- start:450 stop:854 length:405 start_codon:yes stop_codon:yes gene_type:complete
MAKTTNTSGKRKRAVARATVSAGKGVVKVNNQILDFYGNKLARMKIMEPLIIANEVSKKVDIKVNVHGGGWQSQAEASRLAIAKGLVEFSKSEKLKNAFLEYDRHLLVADIRRNEPAKPNDSGKPRAKRQKSYR